MLSVTTDGTTMFTCVLQHWGKWLDDDWNVGIRAHSLFSVDHSFPIDL